MSIQPRIFTRARIANIISATVILWVLYLWSYVILAVVDNTFSNIEHTELLLTLVGLLNGLAGYCANHLWNNCSK